MTGPGSLAGRVALITGVSRRAGIGYAIARRLAGLGATLAISHHQAHDREQPWGEDDLDEVAAGIRAAGPPGTTVLSLPADLADPAVPDDLMAAVAQELGPVAILVCNHARSGSDGALGQLTAAMIDDHYAVNTRSSLLLAQAFVRQFAAGPGRIVFLTSGQGLGPMPGEVAYAASKAALAGVTLTLADQLAPRGITVNCVNPGPVDTGYVTEEVRAATAAMFPGGRWGQPDDPARLIAWLVSDEGRWLTGQVINSEGGFARWGGHGRVGGPE